MIIIGEKINGSIPIVAEAIAKRDSEFIKARAKLQAESGATLIKKYGGKISFMGGIENRAVDFEGWTDENCDAVVRRVCEECGNKYFIPCIAQGGPGSVYPGVYKSLCDSIDRLNEEKFGIKASESTRLPWQIMF